MLYPDNKPAYTLQYKAGPAAVHGAKSTGDISKAFLQKKVPSFTIALEFALKSIELALSIYRLH